MNSIYGVMPAALRWHFARSFAGHGIRCATPAGCATTKTIRRPRATAQGLVTLPLALLGYLLVCGHLALTDSTFTQPFGPRPEVFIPLMIAIGLFCSWIGTLCWNEASQRLPTVLVGPLIVFETLAGLAYAFIIRQSTATAADALRHQLSDCRCDLRHAGETGTCGGRRPGAGFTDRVNARLTCCENSRPLCPACQLLEQRGQLCFISRPLMLIGHLAIGINDK